MNVLLQKRKQSNAKRQDTSSPSIDGLCDQFRKVIVSETEGKHAKNIQKDFQIPESCCNKKKIKQKKRQDLMDTRPETLNNIIQSYEQKNYLSYQQNGIRTQKTYQFLNTLNSSLRNAPNYQLDECNIDNSLPLSHFNNFEESNLSNYSFESEEEEEDLPQESFQESSIPEIQDSSNGIDSASQTYDKIFNSQNLILGGLDSSCDF